MSHTHTHRLIYGCPLNAFSFFFLPLLYKKEAPYWLILTPPSASFPRGFPGNHVRVEEKSKSCEGIASLSPLSPSVCVCIKASLSMLSLHSQLSIALQERDWREGRGTRPKEITVLQWETFLWPSLFFLPLSSFISSLSPHSPNVFWVSLLSASSFFFFFFFLSVSALLGRWLHRCKMGCGNSSATSTSGGGEWF